jgi:HD-GYP domain-containing protein (c-di-GMP phosphodiesterase class II)
MEMELELAVSEQERAELNQSGRGRQWDRPAQAPEELTSDPMEFSVSDFSQASLIPLGHSLPPGAPVAVAVALAEAPQTAPAAPEGSLPPLLAGFALSAPPVAAVAPAAADPVGSLPPALGLFASAPPVPIQHHPPVAPAAAASSVPPLLDFNSTPPAAAAPAPGAPAASVVEHSVPPALGLFDAPPEPLAAPAGLASAPPGPATTEASAPVAEPSMLAPLSVPPSAQALEASVPYELTQGRKLLGAPLLFARTVVALHERSHGDLTGHSVVLSELMRMLAGDLGLSPDDQEHAELAGLLHDVAKSRSRHLTALAVWTQPEHEKIGREQYLLPLQMLGSAGLPTSVVAAITHVYERVDGSGFPNNLGGSAIPLLARLIAVCDSYLDLVLAAGNPLGGVVSASEAIATLREKSGTVFDTALVERLASLVIERRFDVRTRQRQVTL